MDQKSISNKLAHSGSGGHEESRGSGSQIFNQNSRFNNINSASHEKDSSGKFSNVTFYGKEGFSSKHGSLKQKKYTKGVKSQTNDGGWKTGSGSLKVGSSHMFTSMDNSSKHHGSHPETFDEDSLSQHARVAPEQLGSSLIEEGENLLKNYQRSPKLETIEANNDPYGSSSSSSHTSKSNIPESGESSIKSREPSLVLSRKRLQEQDPAILSVESQDYQNISPEKLSLFEGKPRISKSQTVSKSNSSSLLTPSSKPSPSSHPSSSSNKSVSSFYSASSNNSHLRWLSSEFQSS